MPSEISAIVKARQAEVLEEWLALQQRDQKRATRPVSQSQLQTEAKEFLDLLDEALQSGRIDSTENNEWESVREFLGRLSRSRARQGFSATHTASFVFSLKQPLFERLRAEIADPTVLARELIGASDLLDELGLFVTETYQQGREEVIQRRNKSCSSCRRPS